MAAMSAVIMHTYLSSWFAFPLFPYHTCNTLSSIYSSQSSSTMRYPDVNKKNKHGTCYRNISIEGPSKTGITFTLSYAHTCSLVTRDEPCPKKHLDTQPMEPMALVAWKAKKKV